MHKLKISIESDVIGDMNVKLGDEGVVEVVDKLSM